MRIVDVDRDLLASVGGGVTGHVSYGNKSGWYEQYQFRTGLPYRQAVGPRAGIYPWRM